jgi:Holliday junction resolvase RusA-like endonuclease
MSFKITILGKPAPQGSLRAFLRPGMRYPVLTADNRATRPWRQEIAQSLMAAHPPYFARYLPIEVSMDFYFQRPKSAKRRRAMTVKPDCDKLVRCVCDALTGIVIEDDAQIVTHHARKLYGLPERVEIEIGEAVCP